MKTLFIALSSLMLVWCQNHFDEQKKKERFTQDKNERTSNRTKTSSSAIALDSLTFKKIRPHFKTPGQYYDKIEFWDSASNKLVKTVDLKAIHPFNNLPFPSSDGPNGSKQYDLSKVGIRQLESYIGSLDTPDFFDDPVPVSADGQIMVFDGPTMEHFTVAAYNLYLTNRKRQVVAILGVFYVFNDRGDITATIKTNKGGACPIVTQDGKYLAVKYGGSYSECGSNPLSEGILFFDTRSGDMIYSDVFSNGIWTYYFPIHDYIISIEEIGGGNTVKEFFSAYKIAEGIKYHRMFDRKTLGRPGVVSPEDYNKDGVFYSIYEKDGKKHAHGILKNWASFENDFLFTNLKK